MIKPISRKKSTYIEHLSELRKRLIACFAALGGGILVALPFSSYLLKALQSPLKALGEGKLVALNALAPQEPMVIWLRVALYGGLLLASPILLYQLWSFVSPGLRKAEKRIVLPVFLAGFLLLLAGASFAYFLILPLALEFLSGFGESLGIASGWTIRHYVGFAVKMITAFAFAFELPLLIIVSVLLGFTEVRTLTRYRRHAIVVVFFLAAFITPPDPMTMLALALPLVLLYEGTVLVSWLITRRRNKRGK